MTNTCDTREPRQLVLLNVLKIQDLPKWESKLWKGLQIHLNPSAFQLNQPIKKNLKSISGLLCLIISIRLRMIVYEICFIPETNNSSSLFPQEWRSYVTNASREYEKCFPSTIWNIFDNFLYDMSQKRELPKWKSKLRKGWQILFVMLSVMLHKLGMNSINSLNRWCHHGKKIGRDCGDDMYNIFVVISTQYSNALLYPWIFGRDDIKPIKFFFNPSNIFSDKLVASYLIN